MNDILELAPVQPGEPRMKQIVTWDAYHAQVAKLKATAETLTVTDASDKAGMMLARTTRLALKDARVEITKRHKELKEDILVEGRKIDAGKNELLALIEPLEARLLDQEKFAEREEARILKEKSDARHAEIAPYLTSAMDLNLGTMGDSEYAGFLTDVKAAYAAKIEREAKEKAEAEAKAKADAEERDRMRIENDRLRKEAAEREAAAAKERKAAADALAKERAEAAKAAQAAEAIAKAERDARQKIENELAAKRAADAKAEAAKAAAAKAAAMAPEKEKIRKYAADVRQLSRPLVATLDSVEVARKLSEGVERFAAWIEKEAESL